MRWVEVEPVNSADSLSGCFTSALSAGWSRTETIKTRGEEQWGDSAQPGQICRGLRPVPGRWAGAARYCGYRFTGYTTTTTTVRLSVSYGGSWDQAGLLAWTLLDRGKSVSRLPSEYMITLVISQTKSRLGARRSRDEKNRTDFQLCHWYNSSFLSSLLSQLRTNTGNQIDKHCHSRLQTGDHLYFTLYLSNYGFIQRDFTYQYDYMW